MEEARSKKETRGRTESEDDKAARRGKQERQCRGIRGVLSDRRPLQRLDPGRKQEERRPVSENANKRKTRNS